MGSQRHPDVSGGRLQQLEAHARLSAQTHRRRQLGTQASRDVSASRRALQALDGMARRCGGENPCVCNPCGSGRRHQGVQRTGLGSGRALQVAAQGPRQTRASLHLRVSHRHEQRRGKGGQLRRFPHHGASARAGAGLRHPPDHGSSGASLLRLLRLSGEQFLRPELPFRYTRECIRTP